MKDDLERYIAEESQRDPEFAEALARADAAYELGDSDGGTATGPIVPNTPETRWRDSEGRPDWDAHASEVRERVHGAVADSFDAYRQNQCHTILGDVDCVELAGWITRDLIRARLT